MTTNEFFKHIEVLFDNCLALAQIKNSDYANADDPFKNFDMSKQVGVDPSRAILVRLSDKISRISNLLDKEESVKHETLNDTIIDAINYLAILSAKIRERKGKDMQNDCSYLGSSRELTEAVMLRD